MEQKREKRTAPGRDEYIDRNGRVRKHSAAWHRRRKQVRQRLILLFSGAGILVIAILVSLLFAFDVLPPKKAGGTGDAAAESLEENGEAGDPETVSPGEGADMAAGEEPDTAAEEEAPQEEEKPKGLAAVSGNMDYGYFSGYQLTSDERSREITNPEVNSTYAVLVDLADGHIVGSKNADSVIYPASMTKILTILVAAENLSDPDAEAVITQDVTDYVYQKDCSAVGFSVGERVPVRDLFYGTILPSGADAALTLAIETAGSEEAFVEMMNAKAAELGLSSSAHFTNPIGLFDENNRCTVKDMAMILKAAEENSFCRDVLNAHIYTTTATAEHPEGITVSNWFLRRIEDKDCHGTVIGAKTGFVVQSGNCGASCLTGNNGGQYICVTGNAHSAWRCIYDHVAIYQDFVN